jgi:hypothetical protein
MGIIDLFSKRQKKLRGEVPDVYTYDRILQPLRVQVIHIWRETLGDEHISINIAVRRRICAKRSWTHDPHATAKALLDVLFEKGLIPSFWSSHFSGLRATLEAGVPTGRNRLGGHGQGTEVVAVPVHLVAYVLHLTASAIVFLVEAEKALP